MSSLPPAIFLMGPTASGKTDLALELARVLPCELISVDSALVYRGMDIGTAKPSAEVLAQFPHRLVDILDPAESYSAAEFSSDALAAMAEITAVGRIPLLVGGTMLYFKALQEGLADMPAADASVRAELEALAASEGLQVLHDRLAQVDPESAARIHPNDPQRLVRALEVYRVSGLTMSEHRARQRSQKPAQTRQAPASCLILSRNCVSLPRNATSCTSASRDVSGTWLNRASSKRSKPCGLVATCTSACHPFARLAIVRCGNTWTAHRLARKWWSAASSPPGNWPSVSSPGCEAGEVHWLDSLSCDNLPRALKYLQSLSILS